MRQVLGRVVGLESIRDRSSDGGGLEEADMALDRANNATREGRLNGAGKTAAENARVQKCQEVGDDRELRLMRVAIVA